VPGENGERIEKHEPPESLVERLTQVGGKNPHGEPMFRVVWGYNRMVPFHGLWQAMQVRVDERTEITLETSIVETRALPKYLPGNCWHLEMWRPPEEYGTPETWGKLGEEVVGEMTVDTAGPFPGRGEYELCYPLTADLTPQGEFRDLEPAFVEYLVTLIVAGGKQKISGKMRESAIRQRLERERQARIKETEASLLDARPAFYDQPTSFASGPKQHKLDTELWVPEQYRK
jgi:hypothetical protein